MPVLKMILIVFVWVFLGSSSIGDELNIQMIECARSEDPARQVEICTELLDSKSLNTVDTLWAYNNRAVAQARLGDLIPAFSDLEAALKLDPTFAPALYTKGELLRELGQYPEALVSFGRALEMAERRGPQDETSYNDSAGGLLTFTNDVRLPTLLSRSFIFVEQNRLSEAETDCLFAAQLAPDDPRPYNSLGYIYFLKKQPEQSIYWYEKAVEIAPQYGQANAGLKAARDMLGGKVESQ